MEKNLKPEREEPEREIVCRWVNDRYDLPDEAYFELLPPDDFLTSEEWASLEGVDRYEDAHTALIPHNREGARICLGILRAIRNNSIRPLTVHVESNLHFRIAHLEPDVFIRFYSKSRS